MARKIAIRLSPLSKSYLAALDKNLTHTPEGTEEEFKSFLRAAEAVEQEWAKNDVLFQLADKEDATEVALQEFNASLAKIDRLVSGMLGAYDKWHYVVEHINDKVKARDEELRVVIKDVLSENTQGIEFNMPNLGMLAHQIALVVRAHTNEADIADTMPFCEGCI